ncbi:MAG: oxalurate catabolism protein HpxZ [Alphaproteobacteria bacterium]
MTVADAEVNLPGIVAEVRAAFDRYEAALMGNDPAVLIESFWASPLTLRYGVAENLYGIEEIAAYRNARSASGGWHGRRLTHTVITTYGRDFATANTEYVRDATGRIGRQSQTWVRTADGWRVVAAHVSLLAPSD